MKRNWFTLFLAVVFTATFWPVCGWFVYGVVRQAGTTSWPSVQGEVTSSKVMSRRGGKSTTYRPEINYQYTVNGQTYASQNTTLSVDFADSTGYAQRIVSAHPAGKRVPVYYNPADAGESVLIAGLAERDWARMSLYAIFISPPLTLWLIFVKGVRDRGSGRVATVRVLEPAADVTVIRHSKIEPWVAATIGWYLGLAGTAVVVLAVINTGAKLYLLAGWSTAAILAAVAYALRARWIHAGRCDHVIDTRHTPGVLIPARGRSSAASSIGLERITNTVVLQDSSTSTNKKPHFRVHAVIEGRRGTVPLADIERQGDAREFDRWLRTRLSLPERD